MMSVDEIKSLISQKSYAEALIACDNLMLSCPELEIDVARLRSDIYALQGDNAAAADELEKVLEGSKATASDAYLAAHYSLFSGRLNRAGDLFSQVLEQSKEQGDLWFSSAAHFYLAFVAMEKGDLSKAYQYLDRSEELDRTGSGLPLPDLTWCDAAQLREEIRRRESMNRLK